MKALTLWLSLLFVALAGGTKSTASDWSRLQGKSEFSEPHAHLALVAYPDPMLAISNELEAYVKELKDATFLNSYGESSKNPLAPCALLAGGVISVQLNEIWYRITVEQTIPIPPPQTNILGMFDEDIRGGKVPMDDPGKAAEITARLFVWYSWGIDSPTNTIIHQMTQQQCLELLLSSRDVAAKIQGVKPSNIVHSHSPAVAYYSALLPRNDAEQFMKELRKEGFASLSSQGTDNPAAPCSLLRAFRLASRLNEFWSQMLTGTLRGTQPPMLGTFSDELSKGAALRADQPKTAEIIAYLFAREMLEANEVSDALISQASQQECLNEIFRPGLIRMRLLKEGKLPLVR